MTNIIEDVSKLTSISKDALNKLQEKSIWCICNAVYENQLINSILTEIDLGIGKLYISNEEEGVKYKFIPSSYLENMVNKTLDDNKNPLQLIVEKKLANRIVNTYKTII